MNKNSVNYQEKVKMPKASIGLNCFYYECAYAPGSILFPLHWHEHIELIYIVQGWLDVETEKKKIRYEAGDVAVINPGHLHEGDHFAPDTKLYCLMVDMNLFRSRFVETSEEEFINPLTEGKILFRSKISGDRSLNTLIETCHAIYSGEEEAFQFRLKAIIFELVYKLFHDYVESNEAAPQKQFVSITRERVNVILKYVDEHYTEKIKLEDLVDVVHINKYYICKIFQQCTGKTLLNHVNALRVQKAIDLLVNTNDSVTNIAFAVGFTDINYFSRTFKIVTGASPSEVRKKYCKQ